jgi:hypothetical protein
MPSAHPSNRRTGMSDGAVVIITTSDIQSIRDKKVRNKMLFKHEAFVQAYSEYEAALKKMLECKNELQNTFPEAFAEYSFDPDKLEIKEVDENKSVVCTLK